ncbi:Phosphate transporter [Aphelenchoides besseyi]|nr:Phosphate transporter [Aphelenchoides besseyi]KAI6194775.1 Phosphate transporter [Aphelenchoides besseyi]
MDLITTTLNTLTTTLSVEAFQHSIFVYLIIGAVLAFVLGFALGAHDVANTFGTSVGSKVLTIRQAYTLATFVETAGAILIGYNVVDTMRKGVVDTSIYVGEERQFFIAQLGVLFSCALWLLITTFLRLPVSSSHSIVGSTVGFSLALKGFEGINWPMVYQIALSWVISPALSGIISAFLYILVDILVLRRENPVKNGLICLPFFYFFCMAFNTFNTVFQGSKILGIENISFGWALGIALAVGLAFGLAVQFVMRPYLVRYINKVDEPPVPTVQNGANKPIEYDNGTTIRDNKLKITEASTMSVDKKQCFGLAPRTFIHWLLPSRTRKEDVRSLRLFSTIQVFTACFAGFAHGANDVANAISPVAAMLSVYHDRSVLQESPASIWIFVFGAAAIVIGLWVLGHRIIVVVGEKMTHIHPAAGFTIEFGAAFTTILASKLGLPVSTTHGLIGSVCAVGSIKSGGGVNWSIFRDIVFAWILTLPATIGLSAAVTYVLKLLFM